MTDESILQEADRIVNGPRQSDYDHPLDNLQRTADIWQVILGCDVTPEQVGLCLVGLKIAREAYAHKRDNLTDAAGYALTVQMIHEERLRRTPV